MIKKNIEIVYFASLRETIGRDKDQLQTDIPMTAAQAWVQATGQQTFPDNILIALNHEYATLDMVVKPGDELAFFPPVTGG